MSEKNLTCVPCAIASRGRGRGLVRGVAKTTLAADGDSRRRRNAGVSSGGPPCVTPGRGQRAARIRSALSPEGAESPASDESGQSARSLAAPEAP